MGPTPVGTDSSICISAGNRRSLTLLNKCVESDQHQEKGQRPCQPAYSGKVDKGCGLRTTKRGKARLTGFLHGRSQFSWFGQPTDRGDLFQIAAPAIKAMPLNRRFICVSSTAVQVIWQSLWRPSTRSTLAISSTCCPSIETRWPWSVLMMM